MMKVTTGVHIIQFAMMLLLSSCALTPPQPYALSAEMLKPPGEAQQTLLVVAPTSFIIQSQMDRQSQALLPQHRDELSGLADAPYYRIEATVDPDQATVDGQLTLRYTNRTADDLTELVFHLFPNASTIYGGGSMEVLAVRRGEKALDFALSSNSTILSVPLETSLPPKATDTVQVEFHVHIPSQIASGYQNYGIFKQALDVTALAGWYPVLALYEGGWQTPAVPLVGDAMTAEISLFEVTLTAPPAFDVIATGTATGIEKNADHTTWHFVSGPVREFALVLSDRFQIFETEVDGIRVRFNALPAGPATTSPEQVLAIASDALRTYIKRFGPYPFSEFDVVEISIPIGGYEFSGMVVTDYGLRLRESAGDFRYILAHEVAHQWWYGMVGNHSVEDPWLDEALAAYSTLIYLADVEGKAVADVLLQWWKEQYGARGSSDPPVDSPSLNFVNWADYRTVVYFQGALFLAEVRQEIGDERFFAILQQYQAAYRYKIAATPDFIALVKAEMGNGSDSMLARYFE